MFIDARLDKNACALFKIHGAEDEDESSLTTGFVADGDVGRGT